MGRPLLPRDQIRTKAETYLAPKEREEIMAKAGTARLSLATFLRKSALGHPINCVPVINGQRWAALSRTTANLNSAMRKIHAGEINHLPVEVLNDLREQVEALRRELVGEKN